MAEVGQGKKGDLQIQIASIKEDLIGKILIIYQWTNTTVPDDNQLQSLRYPGFIKFPKEEWVQVLNLKKKSLSGFLDDISNLMERAREALSYFNRESDSNSSHYSEKKHKFWSISNKVSVAVMDFLSFDVVDVKTRMDRMSSYVVRLPEKENLECKKDIKYFNAMFIKKRKNINKIVNTMKSLGKDSGMNDFKEGFLDVCIIIYNILYSPGSVLSTTVLTVERASGEHKVLLETIKVITQFQGIPVEDLRKDRKKIYRAGRYFITCIGMLEGVTIFSNGLLEKLKVVETVLENCGVISKDRGLLSNLAKEEEINNGEIDDDSSVPPMNRIALRKPDKEEDDPKKTKTHEEEQDRTEEEIEENLEEESKEEIEENSEEESKEETEKNAEEDEKGSANEEAAEDRKEEKTQLETETHEEEQDRTEEEIEENSEEEPKEETEKNAEEDEKGSANEEAAEDRKEEKTQLETKISTLLPQSSQNSPTPTPQEKPRKETTQNPLLTKPPIETAALDHLDLIKRGVKLKKVDLSSQELELKGLDNDQKTKIEEISSTFRKNSWNTKVLDAIINEIMKGECDFRESSSFATKITDYLSQDLARASGKNTLEDVMEEILKFVREIYGIKVQPDQEIVALIEQVACALGKDIKEKLNWKTTKYRVDADNGKDLLKDMNNSIVEKSTLQSMERLKLMMRDTSDEPQDDEEESDSSTW